MTINYQSIQTWYQQYSDGIYRFILLRIGDREQAKDLVHDTFVQAFKHYESFQGEASEKTWLYQIARNVSIDYLRRKKPLVFMLDQLPFSQHHTMTTEQLAEFHEDVAYLYTSLKKLRHSYREVILLRKISEFSTKETAVILGWKESKVKTTLRRGLQELRKQLLKEGYVHEKISI